MGEPAKRSGRAARHVQALICEEAEADGYDLRAQGEGYARALLDRIGAGASSPDELAGLMQFLHSGPMLHAACAVLFLAMRSVVRPDGQGGRDAG